ncbi:MAG: DNA alkylation repair protein [Caldilinea sp.]|nr:DNA alkylation repair protein [Caldilinea sp.]
MRLPPVPLDDITDQLHALPNSNPDQAFIRRYLGTPRQVLGVRADDLRKLARATAQANQGWDDAAWLALLDALYTGDLFEQRSLAGLLLGLLHPLRRRLELAHLRDWLAQQAGWAEVDTTCQSSWTDKEVLARWAEWDPFLEELSRSESISLRRASLVLLVKPLRHNADARLTQRALANVQRLQGERDRMITKAVSWVLRSMVAAQPETVRRYLDENAGELQSTVVREVQKKLATGRKSG